MRPDGTSFHAVAVPQLRSRACMAHILSRIGTLPVEDYLILKSCNSRFLVSIVKTIGQLMIGNYAYNLLPRTQSTITWVYNCTQR
jgi:hypothetical protein